MQRELGVQEADVERRVVDEELRALHELDELVGDVGEARLVGEEVLGVSPWTWIAPASISRSGFR